jgi:hypothetical protein
VVKETIVLVTTIPYGQLVTVGAHEEMVETIVVVIVSVVKLAELVEDAMDEERDELVVDATEDDVAAVDMVELDVVTSKLEELNEVELVVETGRATQAKHARSYA